MHLEYRDGETLLLQEMGDQQDQVTKGAAGNVAQLLELVPQAELKGHLKRTPMKDF